MKYAIVTGSSRGIGRSIGEKLLNQGYYVFFNHNTGDSELLFREFSFKYNNQFSVVKCDMASVDSIPYFYNEVTQITNLIDVIVFNVGMTDRSEFGRIDISTWNRVFNANLTLPVFFLQHFSDNIRNSGSILFIGSMLGIFPHSMSLSYGVSKSAIHSLVKNLVKYYTSRKVRVNGIAPGFIDTSWQKEKSQEWRDSVIKKIAIGHLGIELNVSELAWHMISNDFINGEIYKIDGGYCFS